MGSYSHYFIALFAIILVVQPISASPSAWSPLLSPFLDDLCKEVECGKGTCKASLDYDFNYICECDAGWKHTRFEDDDKFQFLPCVIPNCTLDYSCSGAPPPAAPEIKEPPRNKSFYDPCFYAYCGEGSCTKSTTYGHRCECKDGSTNLMNVTTFPCFNQCVLGSDCGRLGITVSNDTASRNRNAESYATSTLPGTFLWLATLMISLAMITRK